MPARQPIGGAPHDPDADEPRLAPSIVSDWRASAHAKGHANCNDCHVQDGAWRNNVDPAVCGDCHETQLAQWHASRHGMRHATSGQLLSVAEARQPMQVSAREQRLGCTSCHAGHRLDTKRAAYEACAGCHDDRHTRAFEASPHFKLLQAARRGEISEERGVSCATCHLPRYDGGERVSVQHNQNHNLRPNEKMIRGVCEKCHGVAFAIDALADAKLIDSNFAGRPTQHVASIEWVRARQIPAREH